MVGKHLRPASMLSGLLLAIAIMTHPESHALRAGTGNIDPGSPHKVNLSVALLYNDSDPEAWEDTFNQASKRLFNATEKQMQLGTVKVFNNCPKERQRADITVEDKNKKGAISNPLGLGVLGKRIRINQFHKPSGTSSSFSIVHELGHYAFNLLDEYVAASVNMSLAPPGTPILDPPPPTGFEAFCTAPLGQGKASIMDSQNLKVPAALNRTEFCTNPAHGFSTSHETGYINLVTMRFVRNNQQEQRGEAQWTSLRKAALSRYGISLQEPTSEPQDDTSGHQAIEFELKDCRLGSAPLIDRSGSMAIDSRIELAKQGAVLFVDLTELGEDLAITSFSSSASTDFAMQTLVDEADKAAAKAAIGGLSPAGSTSIGGGLRQALNEILAREVRTDNEAIVLLSDGFQNTGEEPADVLPEITSEEIQVFTVGVGDADVALLADIAGQTGGSFFFASSSADLPGIMAAIVSAARGEDLVDDDTGDIDQGEEVVSSVMVDEFTERSTFLLTWGGSDLDLTLVAPDGTVVDPAFAAANPDTVEFVSAATHEFYRIEAPEVGDWEIRVDAVQTDGRIPFMVQVFARSLPVIFQVFTNKESYVFPEPVEVFASIDAPYPVLGVEVTGTVHRPDGTSVEITLFDDGSPDHADETAADGIYSEIFDDYSSDGTYTLEIRGVNETGFRPELDPPLDPPVDRSIAPFTRKARVAVNVTGVPVEADLAVSKVDTNDPVGFFTPYTASFSYIVTVTNLGPSTATGVTVVDELPAAADFSYTSVENGAGTCSGTTTITCQLDDIAAGDSVDVILRVAVDSPGNLTNTVSVTGSLFDPDSSNNSDSEDTRVFKCNRRKCFPNPP